ncbi:hypothetical protein SD71_00925 [Cohnella kolymensis]|uniref:Crp/Fnr family transcriptional regulator n=1 Tax=Cohnella kolymensis TaxID=1590652 RepID=A0ABR5A9C6_9BACL|nr:Crp/Fnr family transcriptional regulator [Cohnella kolymensis]KIL37293.1 hypothetical protein SD71_00925 [Cohnella kolymensis]
MNIDAAYYKSVSPWVENLSFDWEPFSTIGSQISVAKDQPIFLQEHSNDYVYIIVEGRIRLFLSSPLGEEKHIAIIGKNGLIGESRLPSDNTYSCSATASSASKLIKVPSRQFHNLLSKNAEMTEQVLSIGAIKFRIMAMHILQLSFTSAMQRISLSLMQLALTYGEQQGDRFFVQLQFTHQEMANLVGTSRVTVANTINLLQNAGVISKANGIYIIEDMVKLTEYIEHDIS